MFEAASRAIALMVVIVWAGTTPATAETFPSRAVRLISPYPAGSGPDLLMRLMAERLSKAWQQSVVLEARAGGNGVPAMEAVKAAPADGHTLGIPGDAHLAVNP